MVNAILSRLKIEHKKIFSSGLVMKDFGNASIRHDDKIFIKASGRPMATITEDDFVEVDFNNSSSSSNLKPSSDTPTHLELYKEFDNIGGIVHTHSMYATSWAQSGKSIPCLGTTHADHWCVDIPITRNLTKKEINSGYEVETGKVIIEKIKKLNVDPLNCPGVIVANHGPFTWGKTLEEAVEHAELLEYLAKMAYMSMTINPHAERLNQSLLNKHFFRKHGPQAYYGQENG